MLQVDITITIKDATDNVRPIRRTEYVDIYIPGVDRESEIKTISSTLTAMATLALARYEAMVYEYENQQKEKEQES